MTDAVRAIARDNPNLQGVINIVDFNATVSGQRILDDGKLWALIEIMSRHRLGLNDQARATGSCGYATSSSKFASCQIAQIAGSAVRSPRVRICSRRTAHRK
jgi:type I restriction enzyme M protein